MGSSFRRGSMEARMQKRVLAVLGVLLVAALTTEMATAARHVRKAARASAPVTQQPRKQRGLSAPAASDAKSCDVVWCYSD
jgi:hypothetical protein